MDREDILRRSREEKQDEGRTYVDNWGRRVGVVGFCLMFLVILVFNYCTGQNNCGLMALFWAYVAAEAWGRYRACRVRGQLFIALAGALGALCWLAAYVLGVLKTGGWLTI